MDLGLSNRVALVTGGARGIGFGICQALAGEGARVAINDIHGEGAQRAVLELGQSSLRTAQAFPADVSDALSAHEMVRRIEDELGPIDVLVNNAGRYGLKPFLETAPEDWEADLQANLLPVLNCCHAVLPGMVQRGRGAIISITSEAGRLGERNMATYAAAKAGVIGFTRSLAREVGPAGVRVNCVALATTRTPLAEETFRGDEVWQRMGKAYPLRRTGTPADAAAAVLFLASDQSGWVTGQTYGVNGGFAML